MMRLLAVLLASTAFLLYLEFSTDWERVFDSRPAIAAKQENPDQKRIRELEKKVKEQEKVIESLQIWQGHAIDLDMDKIAASRPKR